MRKITLLILLLSHLIPSSSNQLGKKILTVALHETRTYCFGHSLIDLPSDFYLVDGTSARFSPPGLTESDDPVDVTIVSRKLSEAQFIQRINKRRAEIQSRSRGTSNVLKTYRDLTDHAKLFAVQIIDDAYSTELHILLSDNYIVLRTKSYDNQYMAAEQRLQDFHKHLRIAETPLAGERDYCLGNVFISGLYETENAVFRYRSSQLKDISIGVESDTYAEDESPTLLERVDGPHSLLRAFNANNHVIRKGEVQVASMKAQEWLSWIMLEDGEDRKKHFGFALETMRRTPSFTLPRIHVRLDSGQKDEQGVDQPNSLSEKEAVSLWDLLSRSIRSNVPAARK